jgi:hypothetical protein
MNKLYCFLLAGLICFLFVTPAVALEDEAIPAAGFQRAPLPLSMGAVFACGSTIYDNTAGTYFYSTTTPRWNVLDDGSFQPGTAPVCLGCIEFAWQQTVQQQLYVFVDFWDTVIPNGPVCNATWLGGFYVNFGVVPTGGWLSGSIDLSGLDSLIKFPDDNWCVELRHGLLA